MSCYLVEAGHIDILVTALVQFGVAKKGFTLGTLDNYGTELWRTNNASVNYRYSERNRLGRYNHPARRVEATLNPIAVLKALDGWIYQSCEKPGWENTRGGRLATRLREAIKDVYPEYFVQTFSTQYCRYMDAYQFSAIYDLALWGPRKVEDAVMDYTEGEARQLLSTRGH